MIMIMGREAIARFVMATVLCWVTATVEANYTLEVLLVSYQNPTHMAVSLQAFRQGCCEASDITLPCSPCDNAFRVCGRENVTGLVQGECKLVEMESGLIEENNDDLLFDPESFNISGLTNPITVSGDMWPGTVELVFTVYDLDLTATIESSSDVVDNIIVHPEITASVPPSYSQPETFSSTFSRLELAFRLTCGRDHYGPDCIVCIDTNDTTGHYTCDNVTGDRVCLDGYQRPETNCTDCIPLANCSREGGYCEEPGDCLCRHGFTGEYCDVSPCEPDPCLNTGVCVLSVSAEPFYDCLCIPDCENNKTCVQKEGCTCDMDYVEEQCRCELECGDHGHCLKDLEGSGGPEDVCVCDFGYTGEQCDERECTLECGDNGRCIEGEDGVEGDVCVCDSGFTGDLCETSSESDSMLVLVVGTVGGLVVILIILLIIAICFMFFRGKRSKRSDDDIAPNPYETPFFRKWRGNGHAHNGASERKFENPLYHERTTSPTSPPLPPRPEHPYATLEDANSHYAQIPADLEGSLDEKPLPSDLRFPQHVDPLATANPYDHIYHQSPMEGGSCLAAGAIPPDEGLSVSPRPENPYLKPVTSVLSANPANPVNGGPDTAGMDSSTILYAHIQ